MAEGAVRTRRWTRHEYERLVDCEIFGPDDHIELLAGELIVKEPQHRPHVTAIQLVARALKFWPRIALACPIVFFRSFAAPLLNPRRAGTFQHGGSCAFTTNPGGSIDRRPCSGWLRYHP